MIPNFDDPVWFNDASDFVFPGRAPVMVRDELQNLIVGKTRPLTPRTLIRRPPQSPPPPRARSAGDTRMGAPGAAVSSSSVYPVAPLAGPAPKKAKAGPMVGSVSNASLPGSSSSAKTALAIVHDVDIESEGGIPSVATAPSSPIATTEAASPGTPGV